MMIQTEEKGFAREKSSNALINTNKDALEQYKAAKRQMAEMNKIKEDVNSLKEDISDIKKLLQLLVE